MRTVKSTWGATTVQVVWSSRARFPLMVSAFEGNRADEDDAAGHREVHGRPPAADVTVVADAGMISEANQKAIEAAGLSFILGMPEVAAPRGHGLRQDSAQLRPMDVVETVGRLPAVNELDGDCDARRPGSRWRGSGADYRP